MHHGKQSEQISFDGSGLRLIELKKSIIEKKSIGGSLDFDLKVTDENDAEKVYIEDDEIVPKNSSVVVKRVPAKNAASSLMSRINNMVNGTTSVRSNLNQPSISYDGNKSNDIVINVKSEDIPTPIKNPQPPSITKQSSEVATSAIVADEESEALKAISSTDKTDLKMIDGKLTGQRRAPFVAPPPPAPGSLRVPHNYTCHRCGQQGHYIKYCPTNGDPTFDPVNRLLNVPMANRKKLANLDGVDVANKTVVQNSDGSFEVFEPSKTGRERIARDSESVAAANLELAESSAPENLKCPLSKSLLREAVLLPCCKRCVNDYIIRQELLASGLKCPLCATENVSPDSLIVQRQVREMVEAFIANVIKKPIVEEAPEMTDEALSAVDANIKSQFEEFQKPQQSAQSSAHLPTNAKPSFPYEHPGAGLKGAGFPHAPGYSGPIGGPGMFPEYGAMNDFPPPMGMFGPNFGGPVPHMGMGPGMMGPGPNVGPGAIHPMGPAAPVGPMMPPMDATLGLGPGFGMWRTPQDIPREALFPPLSEEEFYRERQFQINEARRFEERRQYWAAENKKRDELRRERTQRDSRHRETDSRDRNAPSKHRDRNDSRSRSRSRSRGKERDSKYRSKSPETNERKQDSRRDRSPRASREEHDVKEPRINKEKEKERIRDDRNSRTDDRTTKRETRSRSPDRRVHDDKPRDRNAKEKSPEPPYRSSRDDLDRNRERDVKAGRDIGRDRKGDFADRDVGRDSHRDDRRRPQDKVTEKADTRSRRSRSPDRRDVNREKPVSDRDKEDRNISEKKRGRDDDHLDSYKPKEQTRDLAREAIRDAIRDAGRDRRGKDTDRDKEKDSDREKPSKRHRQDEGQNSSSRSGHQSPNDARDRNSRDQKRGRSASPRRAKAKEESSRQGDGGGTKSNSSGRIVVATDNRRSGRK